MRQQKHRARDVSRQARVGVVALGLGAVLAVSACAAGQVAQTAEEEPAVNGAPASVGKLDVRNAALVYPTETNGVYPKGSDAELALTIVNQGVRDDRLVQVSSKAASNVTVQGARSVPGGGALVVGKPAQAGDGGAHPSGSAAPTTPTSGMPPATGVGSESGVEGDPTGHVRIVLNDLTTPFRSGLTARVTFTFRDAGTVTVDMPIATPTHKSYTRDHGTQQGGHGSSGGGH